MQKDSKKIHRYTYHVKKNYIDAFKLLIEKNDNVNVNVKDDSDHTPMYLACVGHHLNIVKLLIKNKVKINDKSIYFTCMDRDLPFKIISNHNIDLKYKVNKKKDLIKNFEEYYKINIINNKNEFYNANCCHFMI